MSMSFSETKLSIFEFPKLLIVKTSISTPLPAQEKRLTSLNINQLFQFSKDYAPKEQRIKKKSDFRLHLNQMVPQLISHLKIFYTRMITTRQCNDKLKL